MSVEQSQINKNKQNPESDKKELNRVSRMSAVELGQAIKAGKITVVQAVEQMLLAIEEKEKSLNCFITVDRENALKQAEKIQKQIEAGSMTGPLAGVPLAVKDNLCTAGLRTTCASKMLEDFVPAYSSTAVIRLQEAGAIIIGKTNMDEFAMGSTTETSYFKATKNPYNTAYSPGGSSGGSAAAVAAGECFGALGSDTGGSVRQPASHCGIIGLKPTYGLISRYGLVAYASSMDQVGILTKTVADCATMLDILVGRDERDATSVEPEAVSGEHKTKRNNETGKAVGKEAAVSLLPEDNSSLLRSSESTLNDIENGRILRESYTACLGQDMGRLRVGIPTDYFKEEIQEEIREAVYEAADILHKKGAIVEEFHLEMTDYVVPTYYILAMAEAASNLERYDGVKYGHRASHYDGLHNMYKKTRSEAFGEEVKRRIMMGNFVLSAGYYDAYYLKALKVRRLIKESFERAFSKYDILLGPVAPTTAPRLGEGLQDPIKMYLNDIYTIPANLAGLPAVSVPLSKDRNGLPIGVQLMGSAFSERVLLAAAAVIADDR